MIPVAYDLHLHSCLSPCGEDDMTPGNIVGMASLMGLRALALTDHNSCKNCPAFLHYARECGILALPGMELTTAEEVHVLCYFETLDDALAFDRFVEGTLLPIPNQPALFGNQLLIDETDAPCGVFDTLLISATSISFDKLPALIAQYRGVMVPAHLDKSSTSLLSNLGMIPADATFGIAEIKHPERIEELRLQHPYLKDCHILTSSDAHQLDLIQEPVRFLHVDKETPAGLFAALKRYASKTASP